MLDTRETLLHEIKDRLVIYAARVRVEQGRLSDGAEDLYRGLLNIMLGCELKNMNHERDNFPAIDLGDDHKRICVQVTSTGTRAKVRHTLAEFFEHELHRRFDRLIVLVIGDAERFDTEPKTEDGFDFQTKRDIWDTKALIREVGKLEDEVLEQVAAYLQKRVSLPKREPLLDSLMGSAMSDDRFVGRETELRRIEEELTKNRVAFLSGLGGMGKTELALRYGDGYRSAGRGLVYFVRFKKTFDQTVTDNVAPYIPGFNRDGLNERQIIDGAMKLLRQLDPNDLLILDNVDEVGSYDALTRDPVFRELRRLPMKLLVTTRLHARGGIALEPLSNPELYRLFDQHDLDLAPETMDALIAAVNAHTMTVDLMARTMDESWETVTAEMILEAMANSSLPAADYPEVYTDHNQDPEQRQIYAHLRSLFTLTNIPEDGKQALRCATLLPQDGMDPALFLRGLPKGPADAIRLLEKQGWVQRENHLLTIHPVVRMVCRTELKPDEEHCGDFLDTLWGQLRRDEYDRVKFAQLAEVFANAMEIDGAPQTKAAWLNSSGLLWYDLMESRKCAALYETYIPLLEPHLPDHHALATAYNNVGLTYGDLGDHKEALEYLLKALEISEKILPPEHPDLATSCNNVGMAYDDLGDHKKALEYLLKALVIREKVLPPEHPDRAASYNNVGMTYGDLGDHKKALEYKLIALTIRETVLPPEHPELAASCNNVGMTYGDLGDHKKALEYILKAVAILEKVLPQNHPHLAAFYNNVGVGYGHLGNHQKALEYKLKALAIREKVLPPEHPSLASSYNNVGSTYGDLGDHKKALEYLLKALTIREKVLPPTHPSLALSCNNIAWTYYKMGEYETALEYMRRAANIADRSLPEGHPNRVDYRRWAEDIECELRQRVEEE